MPNLPSIEYQVTRTAHGVHVRVNDAEGREFSRFEKIPDFLRLTRAVAIEFWIPRKTRVEIILHIDKAIAQGNEHERKHNRTG